MAESGETSADLSNACERCHTPATFCIEYHAHIWLWNHSKSSFWPNTIAQCIIFTRMSRPITAYPFQRGCWTLRKDLAVSDILKARQDEAFLGSVPPACALSHLGNGPGNGVGPAVLHSSSGQVELPNRGPTCSPTVMLNAIFPVSTRRTTGRTPISDTHGSIIAVISLVVLPERRKAVQYDRSASS